MFAVSDSSNDAKSKLLLFVKAFFFLVTLNLPQHHIKSSKIQSNQHIIEALNLISKCNVVRPLTFCHWYSSILSFYYFCLQISPLSPFYCNKYCLTFYAILQRTVCFSSVANSFFVQHLLSQAIIPFITTQHVPLKMLSERKQVVHL